MCSVQEQRAFLVAPEVRDPFWHHTEGSSSKFEFTFPGPEDYIVFGNGCFRKLGSESLHSGVTSKENGENTRKTFSSSKSLGIGKVILENLLFKQRRCQSTSCVCIVVSLLPKPLTCTYFNSFSTLEREWNGGRGWGGEEHQYLTI